jgi:acetoin utilization protein AcuB
MDDAILNFMTQGPHTIGKRRTLAEAHAMMRELKVRHLPVVERGKVVGIVSQRDLHLVETLPDVEPDEVAVDDAMSEDVFCVTADTPLADVARKMAKQKYGSAVVMDGAKVIGIFTATDGLKALDFLLTSPSVKHALHEALIPARDEVTERS